MSDKRKIPEKSRLFKRLSSLILQQTVAAIICLCLALLLKHSKTDVLNNCANALGLAINHNPGWEETVKEAFSDLNPDFPEYDIK